jgi:hypothetical protein
MATSVHNKKRLTQGEKGDLKIITEAIDRYHDCDISCSETYKESVDDIKFSIGEQWPADITKDRVGRPCLVENRLAGMVHQISNDQRQNRPMMKVSPVDDVSDPDVAEVINGLLRHIQYESDSETAFDTAFDLSVRGGI